MNESLPKGTGEITSYASTQALNNMVLPDRHCPAGLHGQAGGKVIGESSCKGLGEALMNHDEELELGSVCNGETSIKVFSEASIGQILFWK